VKIEFFLVRYFFPIKAYKMARVNSESQEERSQPWLTLAATWQCMFPRESLYRFMMTVNAICASPRAA
jgi:hypothetical protein